MNDQHRPQSNETPTPSSTWTSREAYLLAMVCLLVGAALGYFFRGSAASIPIAATQTAASPAVPPSGMPSDNLPSASGPPPTAEALSSIAAPMLAALKADPKNADVLIQLGNLYYDHRVYSESIQYYARALELRPRDVNVRTDLGTAYWYTGDAKHAVAEYERSLAVDPYHTATMMNMGIVKLNGLNDSKGAIATWEKLLKENPLFAEKQKVLDLIAQAKASGK
ncbi:MAG TPA: tetratricopeptide repeat protein [Candidatus Acidoferrales bacterium]|jgi:cytochrome c-type biogenesis protein CcmH/NrfG|nr:tetratricopeptide repeat protein [Candidatus Acidoferrales bacterium]